MVYVAIMTLSQLQAEIDGLIPVIINWEWDSGGGHILVAYGVISSNVCLMDPWYGPSVDDYAWVCLGGGHTWEWTLQISTASVTTNGVPRWWLGMYGLTNQWQWDAMALGDQDGTGQNNLFKYLAGLNPTNPASVFKITSSVPTGTNFLVTWQTAGPRTNVVQATNGGPKGSYNTNFQDISGLIIINTTGDTTTNYTDPGGATNLPSRFYRIRLGP
ncbi:MAG: hypothetical protein ACLQPD_00750 [Desulfomonilaceae bacterium]